MPFKRGDQLRNTDAHFIAFFKGPAQSEGPQSAWVIAHGLLWLGIGAERGYFATGAANSLIQTMWSRFDGRGVVGGDEAWQEKMPAKLMPRLLQWATEGVAQQESAGDDSAVLAFRDAYEVAAQFVSTERDAFQAIASIMFDADWNAAALDTAVLVAMFNYLKSVSDVMYAVASGTGRIDFQFVDDLGLAFTTQLNVMSGPVKSRLSDAGAELADRVAGGVSDLPVGDATTDEEVQHARKVVEEARERWRVETQVLLERLEGAVSTNAMAV